MPLRARYTLGNGQVEQPFQVQTPPYKPLPTVPSYRQLSQEVLRLPSVDPDLRLALFHNVSVRGDDPVSSVVGKRQIAMQWTDRRTSASINCTLEQVGDEEPTMKIQHSPNSSPTNVKKINPTPDQQQSVLNLIGSELDALEAFALQQSETHPTGNHLIDDNFARFLSVA